MMAFLHSLHALKTLMLTALMRSLTYSLPQTCSLLSTYKT